MDIHFKDILLGIAIGDAYGAGLEFRTGTGYGRMLTLLVF